MDWHKRRKDHTHYPVPGNFTVGKRAGQKHRELARFYTVFACSFFLESAFVTRCMYASMQWTHVAVDGNQGCESRTKLPVSTKPYIPACALKLPVFFFKSEFVFRLKLPHLYYRSIVQQELHTTP
jgi:hypothetical protein